VFLIYFLSSVLNIPFQMVLEYNHQHQFQYLYILSLCQLESTKINPFLQHFFVIFDGIVQTGTMYKNNSRNSSEFKGFNPHQLSFRLKGLKSAIGYYSCTKPLPNILTSNEELLFFLNYNTNSTQLLLKNRTDSENWSSG